MLTLQSTFSYQGTQPAPIDEATVTVAFPEYETIEETETGRVALSATGEGHISFQQTLYSKEYHLPIPGPSVFGPNYGQDLFNYHLSLARDGPRISLADITIPFAVWYGTSDGTLPQMVEALFFLNTARVPTLAEAKGVATSTTLDGIAPVASVPFGSRLVLGASPGLVDNQRRAAHAPADRYVDSKLFCLNKAVYVAYLNQRFPALLAEDECLLMYLIAPLVDLSGPAPTLAINPESTKRDVFNNVLRYFGIQTTEWDSLFKSIIEAFPRFFDFALEMPGVELLSVAGNLTLQSSDPAKIISLLDYSFYHLSARFSVAAGMTNGEPLQHISRYDWPSTSPVKQNTLHFSFKDKYTTASILGTVDITVTSYDNLELYRQSFSPADPTIQNLNIALDLRAPPVITGTASGRPPNKKLRGKIVSLVKNCTLKCSLVVQAKAAEKDQWSIVSSGDSDKTGNFAIPYPFGNYVAAQVVTSLDPVSATAIKIGDVASPSGQSVSSDFVFILVQVSSEPPANKEDCGCNTTIAAGRLPSQADIIQSDQYTQDVGGACLSLTVPNRTLREYRYTAIVRNSDPDVANYTLTSQESEDPNTKVRTVKYSLASQGKVTRRRIDIDNPIQWEDVSNAGADLSLYEAVTVSTGHVLHYKSEFRADGYSLGNLIYSLPLAPGQKKEIAIIDASHAFRGSEVQGLSQSEQLAADLISERDITDQIGGNIGERLSGSSSASTWGAGATGGAAGVGSGWGANVGIAGGYSKASSKAQQESGRSLAGFFNEVLRQGIHQNAQGYRQQNSSIVTSAAEAQHYQAETTVVANHNHCHSLTIMHYEVLRHFAVYQELVDVEECVFIPFPLTRFAPENTSKWADVLCTSLLPLHANTYQPPARSARAGSRHPLAGAFDAVERVRTQWKNVDWPDGQYCNETIVWTQGEFTADVNIRRPNSRYDMIKSLPIVTKRQSQVDTKSMILGVLTHGLSLLLPGGTKQTETQVRANICDKFMRLDATYQTRPPAECMRLFSFDPVTVDDSPNLDPVDYFFDAPTDEAAWQGYAALLGRSPTREGVRDMLKYYFLKAAVSEWDEIWRTRIAPEIYLAITNKLSFGSIATGDFAIASPYRGGLQQMRASFSGPSQRVRKEIQFITLKSALPQSVASALQAAGVEYTIRDLRISYSTQHYNGVLFAGAVNNDLLDGVTVYCPLSEGEMRYPKADDQWLAQRLLTHLNQNLEYYNRVLLYSLDPQRRFMLLDGFHIEVYYQDGSSAGYHSLSSVLKNAPIAMAGNSMVFPVSPGYKVDRSVILLGPDETDSDSSALLDFYRPDTTPAPYRLSVPARGVYSEAMLGQCDSCEKVKPDSSQDWTRFGTDEPAAIAAVTPPVPEVTTYQPTAKDFASPMISIQNAPANPDPGAGLASLTELLGKAALFNNITGLDANQANAANTYLANQQSAREAADKAAALLTASQAHNTSNSAQIMGTIQQAQEAGLVTPEQAGQLARQHIQSQIDGGQGQGQRTAAKPGLEDAAVAAAGQNKNVEATTVDGDGKVATVKISAGPGGADAGPTTVLAKVASPVPAVKQSGTATAWVAAVTMLISWKQGKMEALSAEDVLRPAGDEYISIWKGEKALPAGKKEALLRALGLVAEPPATHPVSQFIKWIAAYGPLWVTTAAGESFSSHAKILLQIDGAAGTAEEAGGSATFTWISPVDGSTQKQAFKDFLVSYGEAAAAAATAETRGMLFTQVVHFSRNIEPPDNGE